MAEPNVLSAKDATVLAKRLAGRRDRASITEQVAGLESDCRLASRLITAMLRQVHSSDVFQLPPEEGGEHG